MIVGKAGSGGGSDNQELDNAKEIDAAKSQRKSQHKHNGSESVVIPVVISESTNPLADKKKPAESQHHNDHNGPDRTDDYPDFPDFLRRTH